MYEVFDNLFNDLVNVDAASKRFNIMRTDIAEDDNSYYVAVEMPGVKKEDIKVDFNDNCLKISYEFKSHNDENNPEAKFIRRERVEGKYSRSFVFNGVDKENIKASYNDGVLKIILNKWKNNNDGKSIEIL